MAKSRRERMDDVERLREHMLAFVGSASGVVLRAYAGMVRFWGWWTTTCSERRDATHAAGGERSRAEPWDEGPREVARRTHRSISK
eukprot:4658666-Prymnesium_polylepis.1